MINRYKKGDKICIGQYVNFESVFYDGLCGRPKLVTQVSGQRIYYTDIGRPDETRQYKAMKSIAYFSDTIDEGEFLYECSQYQEAATRRMSQHVSEAISTRIESYNSSK